ncbi:hypothetical protein [Micrococcus luteus]|uniref:hypothetical protein n=1 Tax=Micrococcus luteus TaxID=1270 RepID=UPI003D758068
MIHSLFNTSTSNFGNAAMQAANIPSDTPVEMRLGAEGPGEHGAYIEVSGQSGFHRTTPIDDARLTGCRQEDDGPTSMVLCQQLVDDLATQIRTAVDDATGA